MVVAAVMQRPSAAWQELHRICPARWPEVSVRTDHTMHIAHLMVTPTTIRPVCLWLFGEAEYHFATLVTEELDDTWHLTYVFYDPACHGWAYVELQQPLAQTSVMSIGDTVHAADWHEREAEDLFGLRFEGHPKLGEFVLHENWPEGVNPMRKQFDAHAPFAYHQQKTVWQPPTIVEAPGAFIMPIGPVYSDFAESAHFVIETTGEDMLRVLPRFFYKYRGVEKIAEGKTADHTLLLAERLSGSSAFAHGFAFCRAMESLCETEVPPRARVLRSAFAELERLRHHVSVITGICASTGLAVAQAQGAIIEEDFLRLTAQVCGHRYLFGVLKPGGLTLALDEQRLGLLRERVHALHTRLEELHTGLRYSSSFLDRLEDVGLIRAEVVKAFGLVGPVARASGSTADLRKLFRYGAYEQVNFEVPTETQGDGYARLRILFREAAQSMAIIERLLDDVPHGPVSAEVIPRAGAALGFVEAPLGATFHWLRLDAAGRVQRYRVSTPSFRNWHAFRVAVEHFSFQDFPIVLATFGLSNAECDR